jgi:flagellar motility protein MotE (MotC chaperone)
MGRILFTIDDVMNRANFSDTYIRVVNGKKVVVRKGRRRKKLIRNIAIGAAAIGTTVGILALLATRKKPSRLPTVPVKPPKPATAAKPRLPPKKNQPPVKTQPAATPTPKKTRRTRNEKARDQWRQAKGRKSKEQVIDENTQTFLKGFKQAFMD